MKTKTVYRKSMFPAHIDSVYILLGDLETLQYIAKPYASFAPIGTSDNICWEKGQTTSFKFKLFCLIPFGTHTIHVEEFSINGICTHESNTYVPIWNHQIKLSALPDGSTEYSDRVEIGAGWKTSLVWLWAKFFYAHRQRKWRKLLAEKR